MHKSVRILEDGTVIQDHTYKAGDYANVPEEHIPDLVRAKKVEDPSSPPPPKRTLPEGTDVLNEEPPPRQRQRNSSPPISADGSRAGSQPTDPINRDGETQPEEVRHNPVNRTDGGHEYTKDAKSPTSMSPEPNPPIKEIGGGGAGEAKVQEGEAAKGSTSKGAGTPAPGVKAVEK